MAIMITHSTVRSMMTKMKRAMMMNLTRTNPPISLGHRVSQVTARYKKGKVRLASLKKIASLMLRSRIASRRKRKRKMLENQLLNKF